MEYGIGFEVLLPDTLLLFKLGPRYCLFISSQMMLALLLRNKFE